MNLCVGIVFFFFSMCVLCEVTVCLEVVFVRSEDNLVDCMCEGFTIGLLDYE